MPRLAPARIDETTRPRVQWWQVGAVFALIAVALVSLQIYLNKPPYGSIDQYLAQRQAALHATGHADGPTAKVGWQEARWIVWQLPDGRVKPELIKLDRDGRPAIEAKGAANRKYVGPPLTDVVPSRE